MKVIIEKSTAGGTVAAPPSKSVLHRYLICAALAEGESVIKNISDSEDILATADALRGLGANIEFRDNECRVKGILVKNADAAQIYCRESGSTLRFILPLCLMSGNGYILSGSERLLSRPMDVYEDICKRQNLDYIPTEDGISVCGKLKSGEYIIDGGISSQFVSGLLFVLPMLDGDSYIKSPKFVSSAYIDITLDALAKFGVKAEYIENGIYIPGGQKYKPLNTEVEGDCSNAAFFDLLNYLGSTVEISGINPNSLQGDRVYHEYFEKLKNGTSVDIDGCPDLGPVLMCAAAVFGGGTLTGTARLKIKESDRGTVMAEELKKFGILADVGENSINISGKLQNPTDVLYGHNDHRIVMSLAILCSFTGGVIEGAEAVSKSFPDFFARLRGLGVKVNET